MQDQLFIKNETSRLYSIVKMRDLIRLREYLLHQRYDNNPKIECSLSELVWAHVRYPRLADQIIEKLNEVIPDIRDLNRQEEEIELEDEEGPLMDVWPIEGYTNRFVECQHGFLIVEENDKLFVIGIQEGNTKRLLTDTEVHIAQGLGLVIADIEDDNLPSLEYSSEYDYESDELPPLEDDVSYSYDSDTPPPLVDCSPQSQRTSIEEFEYSDVTFTDEETEDDLQIKKMQISDDEVKYEEIKVERYYVAEAFEYINEIEIQEPIPSSIIEVARVVPDVTSSYMDVETVETKKVHPTETIEDDEILVKIVTSQDMALYNGPDLINFDNIPYFSIEKRDALYADSLEAKIAEQFTDGSYDFTLMVFKKRKNGTYRPIREIDAFTPLHKHIPCNDKPKEIICWLIPNYIKKTTDRIVHLKLLCNKSYFYRGHVVINRQDTVESALSHKKFENVFEEVFYRNHNEYRIDPVDQKSTFFDNDIGNGDILIYTKSKVTTEDLLRPYEMIQQ